MTITATAGLGNTVSDYCIRPAKRGAIPDTRVWNSCLVVLPDGDIRVMYEDALKSKLTFVRFGLDWLT